MRNVMDGAMAKAASMMGNIMPKLRDQAVMNNEDRQLARYVAMHRGRPMATAEFVLRYMPAGANPVKAQHEYERAMEDLARKHGVK